MSTVRRSNAKYLLLLIPLYASMAPSGCHEDEVTPDFQASPVSGPAPLYVQFTDTSTAENNNGEDVPITEWLWEFGDGATSSEQNPLHAYTTPGVYSVTLFATAESIGGKSAGTTKENLITVLGTAPKADFTGTPLVGPAPLAVKFTDASNPGSGTITAWKWDFGDSTSSTAQSPTHTYASNGTYTVKLTVTTANGSDTKQKAGYIVVGGTLPKADFTGTPTSGAAPLSVSFTDSSSGGAQPITAWAWEFGDGGTSTEQNPSHTYTTPGSYTVNLTVTTSAGSDTRQEANYITATAVGKPPKASFNIAQWAGMVPFTATFRDSSDAGSYPITAWLWNFGDGNTSTEQNPKHTYARGGTFSVSLTVTTAFGDNTVTKADAISVADALPIADFYGAPMGGQSPLTVKLTDTSIPGRTPITSWSWQFGETQTSSEQNPTFVLVDSWEGGGLYEVTLTVRNSAGSSSATKEVYFGPSIPTPSYTFTPTTGPAPLNVAFTDTSVPGDQAITSWLWTFGDGMTSTERNPSHTFDTAGVYRVTLAANTVTSTTQEIRVTSPVAPAAAFTATPGTGANSLTVTFADTSTPGSGAITAWAWNFGDGGSSTVQNPTHTYAAAGSYTVQLTVTATSGTNSTSKSVTVVAPPVGPTAHFTATPGTGADSLTVAFADISVPGSAPITAWAWNFGDGGSSTVQNPSHMYAAAGSYTVQLTVTTTVGTNSTSETVEVVAPPVGPAADFTATPGTGANSLTVEFADTSVAGTQPITAWSWDFGDGADLDTTQNPAHTYATAGSYTVQLTVTTAVSANSTSKTVTVVPPIVGPTASFTATPGFGANSLTVVFADTSVAGTQPITAWSWDFGDGANPDTTQNPTHAYAAAGSYTVQLTVTTAVASHSTSMPVTVVTPGTGPTADFTADTTQGTGTLTVAFTDTSARGSDLITARSWDFGDSATSTETNPVHTYAAPGIYDVTLTVTTAVGSDTKTKAAYITVYTQPVSDFTFTSGVILVGATVQFTDASDPGTAGALVSWDWDFGDGSPHSELQNPTHAYSAADTYHVTLTVATATASVSAAKDVRVDSLPVADFTGPDVADVGQTVTFTDSSDLGSGTATTWTWNFGDGSGDISGTAVQEHVYATSGVFDVSLTVTTSAGADTLSKPAFITVTQSVKTVEDLQAMRDDLDGLYRIDIDIDASATASWNAGAGFEPVGTPGSPFTGQLDGQNKKITGLTINLAGAQYVGLFGYAGAPATISQVELSGAVVTGDEYVGALVGQAAGPGVEISRCAITGTGLVTGAGDFVGGLAGRTVDSSVQFCFATGAVTGVNNVGGLLGASASCNITSCYGMGNVNCTVAAGGGLLGLSDSSIVGECYCIGVVTLGAGRGGFAGLVNDTGSTSTQFTDCYWDTERSGQSTSAGGTGMTTAQLQDAAQYPASWDYATVWDGRAGVYPWLRGLGREAYVDFSADPVTGTAPLDVTFTDESLEGSSPVTAWTWDFGDGASSTDPNPTHTYANSGIPSVSLTLTTDEGSVVATKPDYIDVTALPVAAFTASDTTGFSPLIVDFTDASSPGTSPIVSWEWDFGDSQTSTAQNPQHTYADPGTYTVSLTVTTAIGSDIETKANYITVQVSTPTAAFSGTPLTGVDSVSVAFTDESDPGAGPITGWAWSFGDGATSTEQNPTHLYATAGTFTVSLTVTTALGDSTATHADYVEVLASPTADFTFYGTGSYTPVSVTFMDQSLPGSSPITSWAWDFGDGSTGSGQYPAHIYFSAGTFTISLTVTSAVGVDTKTLQIVVESPPLADFNATPRTGDRPLSVTFTDASTSGSQPITAWAWDFGDSATSALQNPTHSYAAAGSYAVSLTVTTSVTSDTKTVADYVVVQPTPPAAAFSATPVDDLAPLDVQFTDESSAGDAAVTTWLWDFGDGSTSTEQSPTHTYTDSGRYSVTLTVTDLNARSDTLVKNNYITAWTEVGTLSELQAIKDHPSGCYRLTAYIDASPTETWPGGEGFVPIGTQSVPFTGCFDGQGHPITRLFINLPAQDGVGLFGYAGSSADLRGVVLDMGSINGHDSVGALIGSADAISVRACSSSAAVVGAGNYVGALAGYLHDTDMTTSCASGNVNGANYVGGLAGRADDGSLSNCFALGNVFGTDSAGGFAGYTSGALTILNSFSAGNVGGVTHLGGFVGANDDTEPALISGCYWNTETSLQTDSDGGEGKTTAQMVQQAAYTGWDFTTVWQIDESLSYPWLRARTAMGPDASFYVDIDTGPAPLLVHFTNTSNPGTYVNSITWLWSFGDPMYSNEKSPSYTYVFTGGFGASLMATTPAGSDSAAHNITVQ